MSPDKQSTLLGSTPAFEHVLALTSIANDGVVPRNTADRLHVRHFEEIAEWAGMSPARYPDLFERIRNGTPQPAMADVRATIDTPGAFVDGQKVDYLWYTATPARLTTARATFTRTKQMVSGFVAVTVSNVNNAITTVLARGVVNVFNQQTVEVVTQDATALPWPTAGKNVALLSWSVRYADGSSETSSHGSQWGYNTASDPVVTAPVQNPNRKTGDLNDIVIGLARGNTPSNNSDIDYWFWQDQVTNSTLLVPLSGSMRFTQPIAQLGPNNPVLEFYLAKSEGGMSDLKATNTQPYLKCFQIDPSDNHKLNFSLLPTKTDAGNAINFGLSPWVSDTRTFFSARVTVMFQGGLDLGWSSILSSTTQNNDPTDGVTFIKPIVYVWHCMAAGTQISLPDATTVAVENMTSGNVVKSGNTIRSVQATIAQPHWGPVYTITASQGARITCSGTHPIYTPSGPVQASSLKQGDTIRLIRSNDTVVSVVQSTQNGDPLYNLWLDPGPNGPTCMYANGILVGDYQIQVALLGEQATDPVKVRAALPAYLHTDFDSHVEDRGAASA